MVCIHIYIYIYVGYPYPIIIAYGFSWALESATSNRKPGFMGGGWGWCSAFEV